MSTTEKSATKKTTDSTKVVKKGQATKAKTATKAKPASNKKARKSKFVDKGKQVARGITLMHKDKRVEIGADIENKKVSDLSKKQVEKFEKTPIPLPHLKIPNEHSAQHELATYCLYQMTLQLFDSGNIAIDAHALYAEVSKIVGRDVVSLIKGQSSAFIDNPINYARCGIANAETKQVNKKGVEIWARGIRGLVLLSGRFGFKGSGFLFPNPKIDYNNVEKYGGKIPARITRAQLKPLMIALINRKYGE